MDVSIKGMAAERMDYPLRYGYSLVRGVALFMRAGWPACFSVFFFILLLSGG